MRGLYQNELLSRARVGDDLQPQPRYAALRRALRAVFDFRDHVKAPWYVYSETSHGTEVVPFDADAEAYQGARSRADVPGENFVAVFEVASSAWPDPVQAHYRPPLSDPKVAVAAAITSPSQVDASPSGPSGPVTSPSQLDGSRELAAREVIARQYQRDLNQETDLLFWSETHHKPGQRLDLRDPADRNMVSVWLATRDRVARSTSPQQLRQNVAARAAFDEHNRSGLPFYVYSRGGPVGEQLIPFADEARAFSYAHARAGDADYVAYFSVADPHWPNPAYEDARRIA